jgi:hypothetical protein
MGKHTFHWCEHHIHGVVHASPLRVSPGQSAQGGAVANCWRQLCHLCHCCRLYCQPSIPSHHCQHDRLAGAVQ